VTRRRPVFREGAWRLLKPLEKGLVLGVLAGAVFSLLTWQISWIAVGVLLGIGIGHLTGHRQSMQRRTGYQTQDEDPLPHPIKTTESRPERAHEGVDEELSAALSSYYDAWYQYRYDPARLRREVAPSGDKRFLEAVGSERGPKLLAAIRELQAEADQVPDPGGPLTNYIDALQTWAATHPEVDPSVMWTITHPLIRDHR
jgi:hypothetical protein